MVLTLIKSTFGGEVKTTVKEPVLLGENTVFIIKMRISSKYLRG